MATFKIELLTKLQTFFNFPVKNHEISQMTIEMSTLRTVFAFEKIVSSVGNTENADFTRLLPKSCGKRYKCIKNNFYFTSSYFCDIRGPLFIHFNPLHQQQTAFKNIVGKAEIARNEQFLLFSQVFSTQSDNCIPICLILTSYLYLLLHWKSLKLANQVKG